MYNIFFVKRIWLLSLIGCYIIFSESCQSKKNTEDVVLNIEKGDSLSYATLRPLETEPFPEQRLFNLVSLPLNYIPLQNVDSFILSGDNKLLFYKDKYYLSDFSLSTIVVLNKQGNLIGKIGNLGLDSGEYQSIQDFNINTSRNEIEVFSNESKALLTYTLDGKYISEKKLPFFGYQFCIIDSIHHGFFTNQNINEVSGNNDLLITDSNENVIQKMFNCSHLPSMMFGYTGTLQQGANGYLFSVPFSDSIYKINQHKITLEYIVKFSDAKKIPQTIKDNKDSMIKNALTYTFLMSPVWETSNYLLLKYANDTAVGRVVFNKKTHVLIRLSGKEYYSSLFNKIFDNVVGVDPENDVFFSFIIMPNLHTAINQNPGMLKELETYDNRLYNVYKNSLPFNSKVLVAYKFNF